MAGFRKLKVSSTSEDGVQKAAQAWGQTIAGLLTIGGIFTVIQGDAKLADLPTGTQFWAIAALILALIVAIYAVLKAFFVAWEPPRDESKDQLNWSIAATVVAVGLLAAAGLILLMAERVESAQTYLVTFADQTVVCGELEREGETLTLSGRELVDVASMEEVAGCPAA